MDAFSHFEKTVDIPVLKQQRTTTRIIDNQALVDGDAKKKWHKAKDGKERTATLIVVNEMVLHHLNRVINCARRDLVQYADLSLGGSYSAQARSAVGFLEEYIAKEEKWIGRDELYRVKESLGHMKRKLDLLNEVEEGLHVGIESKM